MSDSNKPKILPQQVPMPAITKENWGYFDKYARDRRRNWSTMGPYEIDQRRIAAGLAPLHSPNYQSDYETARTEQKNASLQKIRDLIQVISVQRSHFRHPDEMEACDRLVDTLNEIAFRLEKGEELSLQDVLPSAQEIMAVKPVEEVVTEWDLD